RKRLKNEPLTTPTQQPIRHTRSTRRTRSTSTTRTRIRNRTNTTHTRPIRRQARKKFQLKVALYIQIGLDCKYSHNNRRNHGNRKKRNGHRRRTTRHRSEHHPVNRGRALRRKL